MFDHQRLASANQLHNHQSEFGRLELDQFIWAKQILRPPDSMVARNDDPSQRLACGAWNSKQARLNKSGAFVL